MPQYRYTARDGRGKARRGSLRASDEAELYRALRGQGLYLVSARALREPGEDARRLKTPQVADFCQQLGTLLKAGVTLVRALGILAGEEGLKPQVRAVYEGLLNQIRRGDPLSAAMEAQGAAFPPLLVSMLRAAEGTGSLDKAMLRMAEHYQKEYKLNQRVRNAMVYPIVILVMTVLLVIFMMAFVVPRFSPLFSQLPALPGPTAFILGASDFVVARWYLLLFGAVLLAFVCKLLGSVPAVRLWKDRTKLRLPIIGRLLSTIYTARFARTLSTLYSSGMPMLNALQVSRATLGNAYLAGQFDGVAEAVRGGEPLSKALDMVQGLRKKLASSIFVGEETGSLDTMLSTLSDGLDYEADQSMTKLVSLMEPLLIIIMAVIVGFVIIAVMMPIFDSYAVYSGDVGNIY